MLWHIWERVNLKKSISFNGKKNHFLTCNRKNWNEKVKSNILVLFWWWYLNVRFKLEERLCIKTDYAHPFYGVVHLNFSDVSLLKKIKQKQTNQNQWLNGMDQWASVRSFMIPWAFFMTINCNKAWYKMYKHKHWKKYYSENKVNVE